jgi:hypothetical protein
VGLGGNHSEETKSENQSYSISAGLFLKNIKRKIGAAAKGKAFSDETRSKLSAVHKGKPKPQAMVACPHCGKNGGKSGMHRWHFDNCKERI